MVAPGDGAVRQPVALGAQHHCQLFRSQQPGIVQPQGVLPQRHSRCGKAQCVQRLRPAALLRQIRPRHKKHVAHADAGCPPVQRVAALPGQQHRVHAQCRRATEDGPYIGGVHHIFQHGDAPRTGAHLRHRGQGRPPHGAQHPPCQVEAGELGQHIQRRGVDRDVRVAAVQDLRALAADVLRLHEERHRHAACIQRPPDDQRALRNEQGVGRVGAVDQLVFGGAGVDVQLRRGKIGDLDDAGHRPSFLCQPLRIFMNSSPVIVSFSYRYWAS